MLWELEYPIDSLFMRQSSIKQQILNSLYSNADAHNLRFLIGPLEPHLEVFRTVKIVLSSMTTSIIYSIYTLSRHNIIQLVVSIQLINMIGQLSTKISDIFTIQKIRYKRKGVINVVIAFSLLILILKTASTVCHSYWPQQIPNKQVFVVGISCIIHFSLQFLYFCIYAPGYFNIFDWYDKYRINKGVKRPWEDNPKWPSIKRKLIIYLGVNYCVMYPGIIVASTKLSGIRLRFQELPTTFELAWQLAFIAIVQDTFFYWLHRISHQYKFLYKFHKVHHEYTQNFTFVTEYTHPIDYLLSILLPAAFPFMLLGPKVHCFMFFFWQVWKMFISTESHSGYYFPWSPTRIMPCVSDSSFHDFHHSKNIGNFGGTIYLWDLFLNSSQLYFQLWRQSPQHLSNRQTKKNDK